MTLNNFSALQLPSQTIPSKFYDKPKLYNISLRIVSIYLLFAGGLGIIIFLWNWFNPIEKVTLKHRRVYSKVLDILIMLIPFVGIAWAILNSVLEILGKRTPSKSLFGLYLFDEKTNKTNLPFYYVFLRYSFVWGLIIAIGLDAEHYFAYKMVGLAFTVISLLLLLFNFTEAADTLRPVRVRDSRISYA